MSSDLPIRVGDIVNIAFPACDYLGIILQEHEYPGIVKIKIPGYGWADLSSSRCSHATTKERKEYFKDVLKYG